MVCFCSQIWPDDTSLGYKSWIVLDDNDSHSDCILTPHGNVAKCHPPIKGTKHHAKTLGPSVVGKFICGVRWEEPFKTQN